MQYPRGLSIKAQLQLSLTNCSTSSWFNVFLLLHSFQRALLPAVGRGLEQETKSVLPFINTKTCNQLYRTVSNTVGELGGGHIVRLTAHSSRYTKNLGLFVVPSTLHWTNAANLDCLGSNTGNFCLLCEIMMLVTLVMWFESSWQVKV